MIKYKNTVFEDSAYNYDEIPKMLSLRIVRIIMVKLKNAVFKDPACNNNEIQKKMQSLGFFEDSAYNYDEIQKCCLCGQCV